MSDELIYRFVVRGGNGIYEAVDRDCPRGAPCRERKPDGSWVPRKGTEYPGAVSFWKEMGLVRYKASGLYAWHMSVVKEAVEKITAHRPKAILYEDEYQIICMPGAVEEVARETIKNHD